MNVWRLECEGLLAVRFLRDVSVVNIVINARKGFRCGPEEDASFTADTSTPQIHTLSLPDALPDTPTQTQTQTRPRPGVDPDALQTHLRPRPSPDTHTL